MTHSLHPFRLAFLLLVAGLARSPIPAVADVASVGGGDPLLPSASIDLREEWVVGEDDLLLGEVLEIVVDDEGNVFVLDGQLNQIHVISPRGEWLRSIGREGEGPGEFRQAMDLVLLPDDRLGVLQQMPAKVALIGRDGDALDDHPLRDATEGYRILITGGAFDGGLALVTMQFTPNDTGNLTTTMTLRTIDDNGTTIANIFRHDGGIDYGTMSVDEKDLDNFSQYWTVTSDGRIATAASFPEYRIDVHETDGTLVHSIVRPFTPRPRSQQEIDAAEERYSMNINGRAVKILTMSTARVITGVEARPEGRIWALQNDTAPGSGPDVLRYDEFGADGNYLRRIEFHGAGDLEGASVYVRGDHAFVLRGGGDDPDDIGDVTLTCYAIADNPLVSGTE